MKPARRDRPTDSGNNAASDISRRHFLRLASAGSLAASCGLFARGKDGAAPPLLPARVGEINTRSIRSAVELGCLTMGRVFNADDHDIPFFGLTVWPQAALSFSSWHSESHVPGRHLNALLAAEHKLGITIDEAVIEKHTRAAFFAYRDEFPLPLNRDTLEGKPVRFLPHNIREGFHALYALARYRKSAAAREYAERSIAAINRYWNPETGWDRAAIEGQLGLVLVEVDGPLITGIARAIGPLVKYYTATGHAPALQLATLVKDKVVNEVFLSDGAFDPVRFGTHGHSITSVMSSLAQLAEATRDRMLLNRVRAFVENGLKVMSDDIGWSIERPRPDVSPDLGEGNNTGDILETYLILGKQGYPEYLHRAERLLRGHLLPCQLRDVSFIPRPENPRHQDGLRDVAERCRGAFGFPAPYGHKPVETNNLRFNMDIVGGVVGSLCEAYAQSCVFDAGAHRVNLLFDHETEAIKVGSFYPQGALSIELKQPGTLSVRIPPWIDRAGLPPGEGGRRWSIDGDYLVMADPPVGSRLLVPMTPKAQQLVLHHRTRDIRVRLGGDSVEAMDSFGAPLAYFDPLE